MKELFTWMFLFSVDYGVFGRRVIQALSQSEKKNPNVNNISLMQIPKIISFPQNLRLVY